MNDSTGTKFARRKLFGMLLGKGKAAWQGQAVTSSRSTADEASGSYFLSLTRTPIQVAFSALGALAMFFLLMFNLVVGLAKLFVVYPLGIIAAGFFMVAWGGAGIPDESAFRNVYSVFEFAFHDTKQGEINYLSCNDTIRATDSIGQIGLECQNETVSQMPVDLAVSGIVTTFRLAYFVTLGLVLLFYFQKLQSGKLTTIAANKFRSGISKSFTARN